MNVDDRTALERLDPEYYKKEFSNVSYPPRTEKARKIAQEIAGIMKDLEIYRALTVFVHEDGSVSVGISGKSEGRTFKKKVEKLQKKRNSIYIHHKYTVAKQSILIKIESLENH